MRELCEVFHGYFDFQLYVLNKEKKRILKRIMLFTLMKYNLGTSSLTKIVKYQHKIVQKRYRW